jgi:PAS domain S-box-containing protein
MSLPPGVRDALRLAGIVAVYFAAGRFGLSLAYVHDSASAVWAPTGVALAAVVVFGLRVWPAVFAGAFLVNILTSSSVLAAAGIATGNTLEAVVGGALVLRCAKGRRAFERAADAFKFAALGGIAPALIAATVGVATLAATGRLTSQDAGAVWLTWWLGDIGGALIVAPLLILWAGRPSPDPLRARPIEGLALVATLVVAAFAVFGELSPAGRIQFPVSYPILLWAAFRFGPREAATCAAILAVIAIRGTLIGYGPFAEESPNDALLLLQTFLSVAAVSSLAAAAEAAHRRDRERELREVNEELERRVLRRTTDLRRAQERLNEAQQVAHVGSWEWDVAADRVWWSDEMYRTFGVEPDAFDASYEAFLAHVHPLDRDAVKVNVGDALRSREPFAFEHRIERPGGEVRYISARGDVVRDAEGRPLRMRGTAQDVTDHHRAAEAEEANRLKDQFLATLSHELRTPLHAVIGWAQMLLRGALEEDRRHRAVELIYRNALLQSQMITDLLDVSRITSGTLTIERELIDLPSVLEGVVETIGPTALQKQIEIECDIDAAAWVEGDAKRLSQVAGNLLVNAIKFTPAGGRVALRLRRADDQIELQIEDNGPGISPDFLPYVFDRFRQQDASSTREHGGLGLGLAIVHHIVGLHGGSVEARNRTDASGAVFTVKFPAVGTAISS